MAIALPAVVHSRVAFADGAAKAAPPPAGPRRILAYDGAGRLVRVGDGSGTFVSYTWDAAGNSTASAGRRYWHAAVKKPAKGAWVFSLDDAGNLEGTGADGTRGVFELLGTLDLEAGTGSVELHTIDGPSLGTFTIDSVKGKGGTPAAPDSFSATGDSPTLGSLALTAVTPTGGLNGFSGSFGNAKNLAKVGTAKHTLSRVTFSSAGDPGEGSTLSGPMTGLLVRDPKGLAYGTVQFDEATYLVSGKLKNGAKSVKLKSGKGAPVKFQMAVKP
jgi:YD repeat-containing protein